MRDFFVYMNNMFLDTYGTMGGIILHISKKIGDIILFIKYEYFAFLESL